jgi:hypothetical protein
VNRVAVSINFNIAVGPTFKIRSGHETTRSPFSFEVLDGIREQLIITVYPKNETITVGNRFKRP